MRCRRNTGIEAYKPQTFGRQITVRKTFRVSGSITVELLDQERRKVRPPPHGAGLNSCGILRNLQHCPVSKQAQRMSR